MDFQDIIDNKTESRRLDVLLNRFIFQGSDLISIAVGYFYFSGFQKIAEKLYQNNFINAPDSDGKIRFIISPKTDRITADLLKKGNQKEEMERAAVQEFEEDLTLSQSEWADYLIELLQKKKLEVKIYTKSFFHAKAYLGAVPMNGGIKSYVSIVGSSNFSLSGLTENSELNLGSREDRIYKELIKWFDDLWDNHTEEFNHRLLEVIESSGIRFRKKEDSFRKFLSPYSMFLFLLKHYLGSFSEENTGIFDELAEFQRIGSENLLNKMERFGGAIVSDSVGLGKTFTAGEVIRRYRQEKKKVIVLCPPTLCGQWKETLEKNFKVFESKEMVIFSHGKFATLDPAEINKEFNNIQFDLIVIDEAHRLRNRETVLYKNINELHPVSRAKRADVLLLTATPFNNSVMDLKNLIELAVLPVTLTNAGFTPNAFSEFLKITAELRKGVSVSELKERQDFQKNLSKVQEILNAVMLLRMRSTIREKYGKVTIAGKPLQFDDPVVEKIQYKYEKEHHNLFAALPDFLQKLYLPHILISNPNFESGKALSGLYILLLFKRIESSIYAFYVSLQNILLKEKSLEKALSECSDWNEITLKYSEYIRGKDSEDVLDFEGTEDSDSPEEMKGFDRNELLVWIRSDIESINDFIERYLFPLFSDRENPITMEDPKLIRWIDKLKGRYKKCLTFTEFKATADYLDYHLKRSVRNNEISLRFAAVTGGDPKISEKLDRFAPKGRRVSEDKLKQEGFEELDLLISTDVLSEGVNLQDADLLINFDLPWNPMRIVQRIGRVNRIGSENKVYVLNFVPDEVLEEFIKLLEILKTKIDQITVLLGKEMAILSSAEEDINPQTIGEELQKVRSAESISEVEALSHKNDLFSRIEGETEEDFFRMRLHFSSKENQIRKDDMDSVPVLKENTVFYSILNTDFKEVYHLYEIHGTHGERTDLLARFWLYADSQGQISEKHPESFFIQGKFSKESVNLKNRNITQTEELLQKEFRQRLESRKEINSARNISRRLKSFGGKQVELIVLLESVLRSEQALTGKSFLENAVLLRKDAGEVLEDLLYVFQVHQLTTQQLKLLNDRLKKAAIEPGKGVAFSKYRQFAEILMDFYDKVILHDSTVRGFLYRPEEISGRCLAVLLM